MGTISPFAPKHPPHLAAIDGVRIATAAAGIRYPGRIDLIGGVVGCRSVTIYVHHRVGRRPEASDICDVQRSSRPVLPGIDIGAALAGAVQILVLVVPRDCISYEEGVAEICEPSTSDAEPACSIFLQVHQPWDLPHNPLRPASIEIERCRTDSV